MKWIVFQYQRREGLWHFMIVYQLYNRVKAYWRYSLFFNASLFNHVFHSYVFLFVFIINIETYYFERCLYEYSNSNNKSIEWVSDMSSSFFGSRQRFCFLFRLFENVVAIDHIDRCANVECVNYYFILKSMMVFVGDYSPHTPPPFNRFFLHSN